MSLSFKTNLEEMRENDPVGGDALDEVYKASENYDTPGHVRNICFIWPEGRQKFYNYSYLVAVEYLHEQSIVSLIFTNGTVTLEGINLMPLFSDLFEHRAKQVVCTGSRYAQLENENKAVVTNIVIVKNE